MDNRKRKAVDQAPPWEARHEDDARGPLADNSSHQSDRASRIAEGSPGEAPSVHGTGYQQPSGAAHPNFPAGPAGAQEEDGQFDGDAERVRQRAYQLWEDEGRPEGEEERHWLRAEDEVRRAQD